ncbi:MAG: LytTR family DNA-binding domain-containing protein, partial [Fulvivirga sp.]|nr:LytTR family DNA-binding domain-containing protein [Fulvivirga sp.]
HVYIQFLTTTLAVGLAPTIVLVLIDQNRLLKKNLKEAGKVNERLVHHKIGEKAQEEITIQSTLPGQQFMTTRNNLLYFESADNYVIAHFRQGDEVQSEFIRIPLKDVEHQLSAYPEFYRCHRAYIVNIDLIKNVTGNAQGLKISLPGVKDDVPVSRSYIKDFRAVIDQKA